MKKQQLPFYFMNTAKAKKLLIKIPNFDNLLQLCEYKKAEGYMEAMEKASELFKQLECELEQDNYVAMKYILKTWETLK